MKKYLVFVGMGFELIGIVFVNIWVGIWLETQKPMKNIWPVILVFLGLAAWFYRLTLLLKKMKTQNDK